METNAQPQWSLDEVKNLSRFLPTVIREIQFIREWNDTQLASYLNVPRTTLAGWRVGAANAEKINPKVLAELRRLRNDVQPVLWMKGVDPADLICLCNLADVYAPNYQATAEARCRAILAQPPSPHFNPAGIYLDFRICSAFLPRSLQHAVFCDKGANHHLYVILTNYQLPKSAQLALIWRTIFTTIKSTIDYTFNPDIFIPRLISTFPPRDGVCLPAGAKHHPIHCANPPAIEGAIPEEPSIEQVSQLLKDICYGIGYPQNLLATLLGVKPCTITHWLQGDVHPENHAALRKLMALATVARPILRRKFLNPYNLALLADANVELTGQAVAAAFETLRTTIEQDNLTDPVRRLQLDIHIRGADLPAYVAAHCLINQTIPPDLFVILVNSARHNVFEQFNAAFEEIQAHVISQFPIP